MTAVAIATLVLRETAVKIFDFAIGVATAIGLPTTAWQTGGPERSLFQALASKLEVLGENVASFAESAWIDYAEGEWLKLKAEQDFGYAVTEATYATTDVVVTNVVGGFYTIDPGDLTVKCTATQKTYRNTSQVGPKTLAAPAGSTQTFTVVAEESGSGSTAGVAEINSVVVGPAGSTCTNAVAAVGIDAEAAATTRAACRAKQDMISPLGPKGAPAYFARLTEYGGTPAITRTRVFGSTTTGAWTLYVAGPSGGSSAADVALALAAVLRWATGLCNTPTVTAASNVTIPVTYELWIYASCGKTAAEIRTKVSAELLAMFADPVLSPIGGAVIAPATTGFMYQSIIQSTIRAAFPDTCFRVDVSAPSGNTAIANNQVAVLGTVTGTINLTPDPV